MKVANIIGKLIMVVFGIASIRWFTEMLGMFGQRFFIGDFSNVVICVVFFIIGVIITVSTNRKAKKR